MRILITGGCGFIGQNLIRRSQARGHAVRVLDDLSTGYAEDLRGLDVELMVGSILDRERLRDAAAGVDAIVHLAAHTRVIESLQDPWKNFEINAAGTLAVLSSAAEARVKRMVFASTGGAILGDQEPPVHEEMVPRPLSPYGASKLAGEAYCSAYAGSYDVNTVCLRFSNVYGPYSYRKGSVVAHFFKQILAGEPLVIYGDGRQTRDFLYVDDLCGAVEAAVERDLSGCEIFQVASGQETTIGEVTAEILGVAGRPDHPIRHEPSRKGEVQRNYARIDRAKRLLGFEPRTRLRDGLQHTWEWFQSQSDRLRG
jgi:UDP-glucose 4-epimerase